MWVCDTTCQMRLQTSDFIPIAAQHLFAWLSTIWGAEKNRICWNSQLYCLLKTHGLGPTVPHFLTQKSFIEGLWLGLANLWSLVNLPEDPNDETDDTHRDIDASRCLWALYYGLRPDLIGLGCAQLPIPLNCT